MDLAEFNHLARMASRGGAVANLLVRHNQAWCATACTQAVAHQALLEYKQWHALAVVEQVAKSTKAMRKTRQVGNLPHLHQARKLTFGRDRMRIEAACGG